MLIYSIACIILVINLFVIDYYILNLISLDRIKNENYYIDSNFNLFLYSNYDILLILLFCSIYSLTNISYLFIVIFLYLLMYNILYFKNLKIIHREIMDINKQDVITIFNKLCFPYLSIKAKKESQFRDSFKLNYFISLLNHYQLILYRFQEKLS